MPNNQPLVEQSIIKQFGLVSSCYHMEHRKSLRLIWFPKIMQGKDAERQYDRLERKASKVCLTMEKQNKIIMLND